jgi:hypothetical protein
MQDGIGMMKFLVRKGGKWLLKTLAGIVSDTAGAASNP